MIQGLLWLLDTGDKIHYEAERKAKSYWLLLDQLRFLGSLERMSYTEKILFDLHFQFKMFLAKRS